MEPSLEIRIAQALNDMRVSLIAQVTSSLIAHLPQVGIPDFIERKHEQHHQQVQSTVERFHDLVQMATTLDWNMVVYEYEWSSRVLRPMGVTWEHNRTLIDMYFATAIALGNWSHNEREALDVIAARLIEIGAQAYSP